MLDAIHRVEAVVTAEKLEAEKWRAGGKAREPQRTALERRLERIHPEAAEVGVDGIDVRTATLGSDAESEAFGERAIEDDAQRRYAGCSVIRCSECARRRGQRREHGA
jgi:hypothetical protein